MENYFSGIKFKYKFRDYQEEALNMLDKYKNDKKIHVVASPGAGKTILALELMIRIGKKALVLAPTIAIKEQWCERLRKDFLGGDREGLISTELENPSIVTVITYQSLYSMKRKKVDLEKIIKSNNINTIIFDEAHHLRKVWFKVLKNMIDKLPECTTVALTATPPYDNGNDFVNYMDLCGDIDAKITVPQLVKSNCLCPHQDYIYFNFPKKEQEEKLREYRKNVRIFIDNLKNDQNFIKAISLNDYVLYPEDYISDILDDFDFYMAILSFLKDRGVKIPKNSFLDKIKVPNLTDEYIAYILERYLYGKEKIEETEIFKKTFKDIKEALDRLGCVYEKEINFKYTKELSDIILKNSGKLDSIKEIIKVESNSLKDKLKLVIVTDYIKDEYYDVFDENEINVVGAVPIFRKLISLDSGLDVKVCMLTGTSIIIPTDLKDKLYEIAENEFGISKDGIVVKELGIDFNYSKVEFDEKYKRYAVNLITKLFKVSDISVLVGTVALIGEGWDAPFINSLIMASFVASYVTSNQVRGRAIRIDKENPDKVSNIWHLICLENDKDKYVLGQDYDVLSRRFLAYDGLNVKINKIDSGIDRLNVINKKYTKDEIGFVNQEMITLAKNREYIKESWKKSLVRYVPIANEVIPKKRIYKNKGGRIEFVNKGAGFVILECVLDAYLALGLMPFGKIGIFTQAVIFNRILLGSRINTNNGFVKKICNAVYKQMLEDGTLNKKARYYVRYNGDKLEYGLKNADTHEQLVFIKNVKQVLSINSDSRYIVKSGKQIFTIPDDYSKNNEMANKFRKKLKILGLSELIYTKSEKGREKLLKYRLKYFNEN